MVHRIIIASAALVTLAVATPLPGSACEPKLLNKHDDSIYSSFPAYGFDGHFSDQVGGFFSHHFAGFDGFRFPVAFETDHEFDRNKHRVDFHDKTVFMKHKDAHVAKDNVHNRKSKEVIS
ncbi:hypothetical protein GGI12_005598 [Dipsacomyces acuminosporus]|nr:hypothetical protein GGI12_005598 [Dipsacomyces acuminosporus]